MDPKANDECPYKRQRGEDMERRPQEEEGRDGVSDAALNQGMPGAIRSWKRVSPLNLKGAQLC